MLKVHSTYSFVTVPSKILQDAALSLEAKALYLSMWTQNDPKSFSLDLVATQTTSTLEIIQKAYDELVNAGYVTVKSDDINIWTVPQKTAIKQDVGDVPFETTAEVKQKPKKLNKWEQIEQLIENYTEDRELRKALKGYFLARMNPATTSRFSVAGSIQVYQVNKMLQQLDTCTGDKVKIVEYCKENEYMKFFDLPKPKSFDGIKSESISADEMDAIRKRWAELEAQGKRTEY